MAATDAHIFSKTTLTSSLNTAVTGSKIIFTADVDNASTSAPIPTGKVQFVVQSPKKIVLGTVSVNKQGEASVATTQLTKIGDYQVAAQYTPTSSSVSKSVAERVTVNVIPIPLNVPTTTKLTSVVTLAETGQHVPLLVSVTNAGTGNQVNAGRVEPILGKVEFLVDSPTPTLLTTVKLNKKTNEAGLSTNMLKKAGPYQIQAEFVPTTKYFAASVSAPVVVTITPRTVNAPTSISLQAVPNTIETGEPIAFNTTVQNANSSLADGVVTFFTVARHPVDLGQISVGQFGQQISFGTFALEKVGFHQIEAKYVPNSNRFAPSFSAPITVAVTPLTAASFRVTPVVRHGKLNKPLSFSVTALNNHGQPLTNYTGTVVFSSPTDSFSILPKEFYVKYNLTPSAPPSSGLATFPTPQYTFTTADHGTHTVYGGVIFDKAGAETLQVTQANNRKVFGTTTFAIQ